jgi:membrane protease YdiL (CAAX protease family)
VRELLGRLLRWRVRGRWYAFALGYFAVVKLAAAALYRVGQGSWPPFGPTQWYVVLLAIVLAGIVGGPLGEEIGWRGFALPALSDRLGPAVASLVLGLIWACWHLPLFVLSGLKPFADQHGQSFPTYAIQVTALSVALAWLMGRTGGSLLLAVLMHSAINQTKDIVSSKVAGASNLWAPSHSAIAWLTVAILVVTTAFFLWDMRRRAPHP